MTAYALQYIVNAVDTNIIGYVIDFRLEQELEKLLDKLTLKISRSVSGASGFEGFNPNVELLLKFNDVGIFRGRIKTSNLKEYYEIEAYSCAEILSRIVVQKIYENTTPEAIFTDLITNYTDLTPIVPLPSGVTIQFFVANDFISSIVSKINDVLGWSIYSDSDKNIYFQERGHEENGVIIRRQAASSNAKFGKWKKDYNEICNDVKITGGNINYYTTETFIGNGTKTTFTLLEQPTDIQILIDSVEQNVNTYTVFSELKAIVFEIAPVNLASIVVNYTYVFPLYCARSDVTSIEANGKFTKILFNSWLKTRSDIVTFANNYIDAYKDALVYNDIQMNPAYITIFTPGEQVRIIDDFESYDDYYIINKIKLEYLTGVVELNVGSYIPIFITAQNSMQDRIKELEKNLSKSLSYSQSIGVIPKLTPVITLSVINEFDTIIPLSISFYDPPTEQAAGTFLVGTARVGFSEAA
jgi:cell fate (sporulation/competence/biofilm development) regulator YlbF (YheA/YmcA/DUF963 family)